MAQHDFLKLASQGRGFDATRGWTEEELIACEALTNHGVGRLVAADYVRNGITTVAQYEATKKAGFEPKSLETLRDDAVKAHQEAVRELYGLVDSEPEVETPTAHQEAVRELYGLVDSEPEVETPTAEVAVEEIEVQKSSKRGAKNK